MTVRSDRLGGPTQIVGTATSTFFTVPSGETWLVKWIALVAGANAGTHDVRFFKDAVAGASLLHRAFLAPTTAQQLEVWWAMEPGTALLVNHATALVDTTVTVWGAKLLGVA